MNILTNLTVPHRAINNVVFLLCLVCTPFQLFASEEIKLDSSQAGSFDRFGRAVSMTASGTTIAVGAPAGFIGSDGPGAVHVFELIGTSWVLQQKLSPDDSAADDFFGSAVAISPDGSHIVAGNWADDSVCPTNQNCNSGAAYVFVRSGDGWTLEQKIMATDGKMNNFFGSSVAVSNDGNFILIGSPGGAFLGLPGLGAAYLFGWNGESWVEQETFASSTDATNNFFASSLAMDDAANVIAIGDNRDDSGCANNTNCDAGAVFIYQKQSDDWIQQGIFTGAEGDGLGNSVDVSGDGSYIIGGANFIWTGSGYAQIYQGQENSWTVQDTLISSDGDGGSWYANSVTMNNDGSRVVVGANFADASAGEEGAAYMYQRVDTNWQEIEKIVSSDAEFNDEFGNAVTINAKGDIVGIGAQNKDTFSRDFPYRGAAYIYTITPSLGGSADAISINTVRCTNRTTGQRIQFQLSSTQWNCVTEGLVVNPRDRVQMSVNGIAN